MIEPGATPAPELRAISLVIEPRLQTDCVAGGAKALVFGIATLTDVHWSMSGEVVLMTLLGGLGTPFRSR